MRVRAVLDTNIFVSGIHWTGASEKVVRSWMEEKFVLVSSLPIIDEIVRVLMAFKVPLEPEDIFWWESLILEKSSLVFPVEHLEVVKNDSDDDKFIEAAVEGKAQYIVSQDKHLLNIMEYKQIKILHPDEFLRMLR
ncbi:putative toxin-antitoxin system toxin component, PIN family [Candidatus Woesearchaeota archaeon]|nr:putative toxin-antitoxin system toxin component, PIN family [Candidatus Woesearchaeota archaeon]